MDSADKVAQISAAVDRAVPTQVAVNGAAYVLVKAAEINWLTVLYVILALLQIGWWVWKYIDKLRGKSDGN